MSEGILHVEVVAADRVAWSGKGTEVVVRSVDGDLGILPGHAPVLAVLAPGVVTIHSNDGEVVRAVLSDGFVSVAQDRISILSEDVLLPDDLDKAVVDRELTAAVEAGDEMATRLAQAKLALLAAV